MCGIFFSTLNQKKDYLKWIKNNSLVDKYISKRGLGLVSTLDEKNIFMKHYRLPITGSTKMPCMTNNDIAFLFNGEIYNLWEKYSEEYGDVDFLKELLESESSIETCCKLLDGEFAITIYDFKSNQIILITDQFATKPLFYGIHEGDFLTSSYYSTLLDLGCDLKNIFKVPANTIIRIENDGDRFKIINKEIFKPFDFRTNKSSNYDHFEESFNMSIKKRAQKVNYMPWVSLSSGCDSGLIASTLKELGCKFECYYVELEEDLEVLHERISLFEEYGTRCHEIKINPNEKDSIISELREIAPDYFQESINQDLEKLYGHNDYRLMGAYIASSKICKAAFKKNQLIHLSGQGVDEIISDYFNPSSNSRRSVFRGLWPDPLYPWQNFYEGWNEYYLAATERIGGAYSIENRYPFLDHAVVQSFLSLPVKLKSASYKAPLLNIFKKQKFPYTEKKIGFRGCY